MSEKQSTGKSEKWMLLLLFIFFACPILIVMAMHALDIRPQGKSHGVLISPSVPIELKLASQGGVWNERWSLVYVTNTCDQACANALHDMRQVHVSLAKEIPRVQRMLIAEKLDKQSIAEHYPDLIVIDRPTETIVDVEKQFNRHSGQTEGLYLVDPLGNLVMYYKPESQAKLIRADLMKLLKFSWAG